MTSTPDSPPATPKPVAAPEVIAVSRTTTRIKEDPRAIRKGVDRFFSGMRDLFYPKVEGPVEAMVVDAMDQKNSAVVGAEKSRWQRLEDWVRGEVRVEQVEGAPGVVRTTHYDGTVIEKNVEGKVALVTEGTNAKAILKAEEKYVANQIAKAGRSGGGIRSWLGGFLPSGGGGGYGAPARQEAQVIEQAQIGARFGAASPIGKVTSVGLGCMGGLQLIGAGQQLFAGVNPFVALVQGGIGTACLLGAGKTVKWTQRVTVPAGIGRHI